MPIVPADPTARNSAVRRRLQPRVTISPRRSISPLYLACTGGPRVRHTAGACLLQPPASCMHTFARTRICLPNDPTVGLFLWPYGRSDGGGRFFMIEVPLQWQAVAGALWNCTALQGAGFNVQGLAFEVFVQR